MSLQVLDESWLHINIFKSSCTIRGKLCRFMIDSGSCTNVISEEAVSKLALFAKPHPTPYKLVWLNTQTEIRISRQCKVPFSVGTHYRDLICCDIVPMNACHLLLGRPWQFDRRTTHDGFANTYSFLFESRRITFLPTQDTTPLNEPLVSTPAPAKALTTHRPVMLLSKKEFAEELRVSDVVFALMATSPTATLPVPVPPAFAPLIHKFQDVFPDDLPRGLPPYVIYSTALIFFLN